MNKVDVLNCIKELNFPKDEYWLVAGSAMVLYGFRIETNDVDLGCTKALADQLQQQNYPVEVLKDGKRRIIYSNDVEIFEDWIIGDINYIEDIPTVSIDGLLAMKKELGREKDKTDIELIMSALKNNNKEGV